MKTTDGFKWHCSQCGEDGILGVDGFGAKGMVRPRNIMHEQCFEALTTEQRRLYLVRDRAHTLWISDRRKSKRNLDRESMRRRQQRG